MNEEFRQRVIEALRRGEELPREWARELFPPEKREYELVYHDKDRVEDIIGETMAVPLQPVTTFGSNGNNKIAAWHNMLIFGDNLQVMKMLLEHKKQGKLRNADGSHGVRLIYIDPPFASKQEFSGTKEQKAYQDKVSGAKFIEFIRKRLTLLRELLASDGSLFLHVDYRKAHYLKIILDELFGEHNLRNEIILPGRASKNLQQQFDQISRLNVRHDTLLWYSASSSTKFAPLWVEKHNAGNPEGHWHHFWSTADRPTMRYELFGIKPATGQWTWEENRAKRAVENYKRYLQEAGDRTLAEYWRDTGSSLDFVRKSPEDGKPQYWRAPAETRLADTMWSGVPIYSNSTGYPTEKNEAFMSQVLNLASAEGDIVLDAFAGSGTTLAVAEKLGRRWIGIDGGKLSIYTIQKRLLSLRRKIGNKGAILKPKPFTVYNAGLYDFSTLRKLPWEDWRFFALGLFGCKDEPHRIGGIDLDGKLKGASVLVFNHLENPDKRIDEETVESIHAALRNKISRRFFIIAPRGVFDFQQDYIEIDGVRYFALRIPYSVISELHSREFTALQQPNDERAINALVESVGFHFIQPPVVEWKAGIKKRKEQLFEEACLKVKKFKSHARLRGEDTHGGLESFSMLMIDYDYAGEVFEQDAVYFAHQLEENKWEALFPYEGLGEKIMALFIDIHGNEARVVIPREKFGTPQQ
jgi:site-specific DNA-methyltransferase (adenine-specific)/adenine-specific DNA-methyltransferase